MSKTQSDQDNFKSMPSGSSGTKMKGIAFTLRIGLLCIAGVVILMAILTTTIFGVLSSNFGSFALDVIPTTEEALHLTNIVRSIDSTARDLPNMHESFGVASTAYKLRQLRNELSTALDRLGPSLMKSEDLDIVRNNIEIMNRQLEYLVSIVQQRNKAETLQRAHIQNLEDIYRNIESLGLILAGSHEKQAKWTPLFMAMIRGAELLIASLAMEDPRHIIEHRQEFKKHVELVEAKIDMDDTHMEPRIKQIFKKMLPYQTLFDEKLKQIQLGMHIQTAVKSLAVMDRLIDQIGTLSGQINEAARIRVMEMNRISIHLRWIFGLIALFSVFGLVGLLVFINRRIVERMQHLQEGMLSHVAGKPQPISKSGSDEISDMAKSFLFYVDKTNRRKKRIQERTRQLNETLAEQNKMETKLRDNQKRLELTLSDLHQKNKELESSTEEIRKAKEVSEQSTSALHHRIEELAKARRAMLNMMVDLDEAKKEAESATLAKSEFLANMSHEIRTPMNALLGFISLVLEDIDLKQTNRQNLKTAKESGNALLSIINEILDLSKAESGKLTLESKPFNIQSIVGSIINTNQLKAQEKGLTLDFNINEDVPENVIGDPTRFRQILINLVGNAIKFTEKGSVEIIAQKTKEENMFVFSVKDTGIGIPEDRQDKIFQSFEQADASTTRRFGGTGLGTTISKQFVELMGGKIWVESEAGIGSTFYFTARLPATDQKPEEDLFGVYDTPIKRAKRLFHVLLAEDTPANVTLAISRLEKQGHSVKHVWNGRQAVELFEEDEFDIILMDVQMPEMDGLEATRHIRLQDGGDLPILALTASVTEEDKKKYIDAGLDDVVGKPTDFGFLFNLMERIVPAGKGRAADEIQSQDIEVFKMPDIQGVDVNKGLSTYHDIKLYTRELFAFSKKFNASATEIKKTIEKGDIEGAHSVAHRLKGVSGNLAIFDVFNITVELNDLLAQKAVEEVKKLLPTLDASLSTAVQSIKQFESSNVTDIVPKKEMDKSTVKLLLNKINEALSVYDIDSTEASIQELASFLDDDELSKLIELFQSYNYDGATAEVHSLLAKFE